MKKNETKFYPNAKAICTTCGAVHHVGSTLEEFKVEICSKNHPFYLGKGSDAKIITGRVEKFYNKYKKTEQAAKKEN